MAHNMVIISKYNFKSTYLTVHTLLLEHLNHFSCQVIAEQIPKNLQNNILHTKAVYMYMFTDNQHVFLFFKYKAVSFYWDISNIMEFR